MSDELLTIARAELPEEWRRVDLVQALSVHGVDITDRQANEKIKVWKTAGYIDHIVDGKQHRYAWREESAVSATSQTEPQMSAHAPASVHTQRTYRIPMPWIVAGIACALVVAAVASFAALTRQNEPVSVQSTPTTAPTATPTNVPMVAAYYAPGGEYAQDIPIGGPVTGTYGHYVQIDGHLWIEAPDLTEPTPAPTQTPHIVVVGQPAPPVEAPAPTTTAAPILPPDTVRTSAGVEVEVAATATSHGWTIACNADECQCFSGAVPDGYSIARQNVVPEICMLAVKP
jgi:hypothetical protein